MHAYNPRQQKDLGKRKDFQMLRNLPDLPPPPKTPASRRRPGWLLRIAVCFVLVSLALVLRSAWVQP